MMIFHSYVNLLGRVLIIFIGVIEGHRVIGQGIFKSGQEQGRSLLLFVITSLMISKEFEEPAGLRSVAPSQRSIEHQYHLNHLYANVLVGICIAAYHGNYTNDDQCVSQSESGTI